MELRIHAFEPFSRANGPGRRAVIWTQGCSIGCPGCFNAATHASSGGRTIDTAELAAEIISLGNAIDGVTISGGEPTEQALAIVDLLKRLGKSSLSRMLFSGRKLEAIRNTEHGLDMLEELDVLIAGRFLENDPSPLPLLGSRNQKIHFLTDRHSPSDMSEVAGLEIIIHRDGTRTMTGMRRTYLAQEESPCRQEDEAS